MSYPIDGSRRVPHPQPKQEKTCGCWPKRVPAKKTTRHERELTQHEIDYSKILRTERAAKAAFGERKA